MSGGVLKSVEECLLSFSRAGFYLTLRKKEKGKKKYSEEGGALRCDRLAILSLL